MKRCVVIFLFLFMTTPVFAETIQLKSGKMVEGKIIERNDRSVQVDSGIGVNITYYLDEIETIDGKKIADVENGQPAEAVSIPEKQIAEQNNDQPVPSLDPQEPAVLSNNGPAETSPAASPVLELQENIPSEGSVEKLSQKVQGEIEGRPFTIDEAVFNNNTLEFKQGKGFFSDLGIVLFLFSPKGPSWENTELHITPETKGMAPHIHKKWKAEGSDVPKTKIFMSGYYLDLSMGEIHDGKIQGTINLRLPDESNSHMEGTFEALVGKQSQAGQGATVTITQNGKTVTRPMTKQEKTLMGSIMGILLLLFLAIYVVSCIPFYLISKKSGIGNSFFALIPLFNLYLMVELAKKPGWWFILLFIPLVNLVIIILMYCGIAKTCRQPAWVGLLVIIPLVNLLLPWYFLYSINHTREVSDL